MQITNKRKKYLLLAYALFSLTLLSCANDNTKPMEAQKKAFASALEKQSPVIGKQIKKAFNAIKSRFKNEGFTKLSIIVDNKGTVQEVHATGQNNALNKIAIRAVKHASPLLIPKNMPYKRHQLVLPIKLGLCHPICDKKVNKEKQ